MIWLLSCGAKRRLLRQLVRWFPHTITDRLCLSLAPTEPCETTPEYEVDQI